VLNIPALGQALGSYGRCRSMQPRQVSMRLSRSVWTTATLLHMVFPTTYSSCAERCMQHAWSPVREGMTTSHRSCGNYIGCQCDSGWNLSLLFWSVRPSPQYLTDDCQLLSASHRQLRSSETFKSSVLRKRSHLGDRAFAAAGPQL